MNKTYVIEIDCAGCTNLPEEATHKTMGGAFAAVNFITV